jgi:PHD/YefM family antitoxin component YafN of YafNO toxin-antitoxin module
MNSIAAQEIKRRGISSVDEKLREGPVHIIKNNEPKYVVLSEERYRELIEAEEDAHIVGVRESLADYKAGRIENGSAEDLIKELGLDK